MSAQPAPGYSTSQDIVCSAKTFRTSPKKLWLDLPFAHAATFDVMCPWLMRLRCIVYVVEAQAPGMIRGAGAALQAVWPQLDGCCCRRRRCCMELEPEGAILGAGTSHYRAAGVSGLNSSADWEPVDCNFYRITMERIREGKESQTRPHTI